MSEYIPCPEKYISNCSSVRSRTKEFSAPSSRVLAELALFEVKEILIEGQEGKSTGYTGVFKGKDECSEKKGLSG